MVEALCFVAGAAVFGMVAFFSNDAMPGRIRITGDGRRNEQFRWTLVDDKGMTLALGSGSHANWISCAKHACRTRRWMRGSKVVGRRKCGA